MVIVSQKCTWLLDTENGDVPGLMEADLIRKNVFTENTKGLEVESYGRKPALDRKPVMHY